MTSESSWLRFRLGKQWRWRHCFKLLFVRTVLEEEGEEGAAMRPQLERRED
jgi:hypothetical protein